MFNLELPINGVSFGQVSVALLREIKNRSLQPNIFPIGAVDFGSQQNIDDDFKNWFNSCIHKSLKSYKRNQTTFKLWHLNGSHTRITDKVILLTFYETDNPTEVELNIVRSIDKVLFTSEYSTNTFKEYGVENVDTVPLGFDKYNFWRKEKNYINDKIVINVTGKWEHRKRHDKLVKLICKKWGNDRDLVFQLAVYNPFFKPEDNRSIFFSALEGRNYWNIQFLGYMSLNSQYNDYLNSSNIIVGVSGGEGWGLPEFQSVAIGKHAVILNAHGYKMWADQSNAVLLNPLCKIPAYDGIFFNQGAAFSQGNIYDFDEEDFINCLETCINRVRSNPINSSGLELQKKFTIERTVDKILQVVNE